jgi:uncharacterized secreted protein with C-terminal beta-propeller domain
VTPSFSDTNVQERGVDEPDIVKTDGRRILTLTRNTVRISRHDAEGLRVEGSFELPTDGFARALLLEGNRAIVFGDVNPPDSPPRKSEDGPWLRTVRPWSAIWVIDVTSASAMRVESTLYFDGRYADARMTGGRIRVVVNTAAVGPTFVTPTDGSQRASDEAERRNREVIERSTIDDWSPRYLRLDGTDRSSGRWGRLCACDRVLRPDEFSGLGNITVLTIDPANPDPADATAVQGAGQTVYASAANLYATTRGWGAVGETTSAPTAVHRFDITGLQRARYIGSASVRGALLSQFALSEHEGHLRVATTEYRWGDPDGATRTDNLVTVLALRDGGLETVGQIAGLGARGETIRAVRFIGALGYLVTFRQTDPLYVLDFSAPEKPVLRGELKTPGFSAYLHPTEEGFLLGVGWDADEEGRWRGEQVSTFDVRNPEQPTQVDHFAFGANSTSEVQRDHHAFLYWALTRTAVIPVERYSNEGNWAGAFVMRLDADHKLVEVGRVTHTAREQRGNALTTVRRSLVIGDNLYTMSDAGLLASDINTAADRTWLPF